VWVGELKSARMAVRIPQRALGFRGAAINVAGTARPFGKGVKKGDVEGRFADQKCYKKHGFQDEVGFWQSIIAALEVLIGCCGTRRKLQMNSLARGDTCWYRLLLDGNHGSGRQQHCSR